MSERTALCTDIRRIPEWIVYFNGVSNRVFCFVIEAQRVTKKHVLKEEAVLDLTAAASQNVSK